MEYLAHYTMAASVLGAIVGWGGGFWRGMDTGFKMRKEHSALLIMAERYGDWVHGYDYLDKTYLGKEKTVELLTKHFQQKYEKQLVLVLDSNE